MFKFKNTIDPPCELPITVWFTHRDPVEEINGFIELEETDDIAVLTVLHRGYGLVTSTNPDPKFGDTDINKVMELVQQAQRQPVNEVKVIG